MSQDQTHYGLLAYVLLVSPEGVAEVILVAVVVQLPVQRSHQDPADGELQR